MVDLTNIRFGYSRQRMLFDGLSLHWEAGHICGLLGKNGAGKGITAYILANPGRFVKPRKRSVGAIGAYGLATDPAYVRIVDADAAVAYALENGYEELLRVTREVEKEAVLRHAAAGETIPGIVVVGAGDVAKLTFRKGYAEALEA